MNTAGPTKQVFLVFPVFPIKRSLLPLGFAAFGQGTPVNWLGVPCVPFWRSARNTGNPSPAAVFPDDAHPIAAQRHGLSVQGNTWNTGNTPNQLNRGVICTSPAGAGVDAGR